MNGVELIIKERRRQQSDYDVNHDAQYECEELAHAAASYAVGDTVFYFDRFYRDLWPWNEDKDSRDKQSRIRQLMIAGALCAAEIDRLLIKPMRVPGRSRWEKFLSAWYLFRFKVKLGPVRSLWCAVRLSRNR